MGRFITSKARIEQTNTPGYWKTIDNELFMDDNEDLILTPRYLWTDGYTFPAFVMPFLGDKNKYDTRACHAHDLFCRFHQVLKVNLSLAQLKLYNLVREHKDKIICEDIPLEHVEVLSISKNSADNTFKRMMIACDIPTKEVNIIRFGVFFNLNWWLRYGHKSILEYDIYKEDIGLVNGL